MLLAAPAVSGDLLVNPSFDSGTAGWSRSPTSWSACVTLLGQGDGWAGMRLACAVPPVEAGLKQVITVRGGQLYRVGFRFQASGLSAEGDVILSFRGPQGVVWQTGVEAFAGSWPWSEVSWVVQAPAAATALELRVEVSAGIEGEAGFDDLVFEEVEAAPPLELTVEVGRIVGRLGNLNQTNPGPVLDTRFAGVEGFYRPPGCSGGQCDARARCAHRLRHAGALPRSHRRPLLPHLVPVRQPR